VSKPPMAASQNKSFDTIALLKDHPIFGEFAPEQLKRLASYARRRQAANGTVIFEKGDPGNALYAIRSGTVKIAAPSEDGRETSFNLLHPGEVFGEIALLDGQPRTADAVAASDCDLVAIERRDFVAFMESEPKLAMKLIELLCERLRFVSTRLEEVVFLNLPARLARLLLRLAAESPAGPGNNELRITQNELGKMLGTARESVNRVLRQWARRGLIAPKRGGLILLKPQEIGALVRGKGDGGN
jgi:CRP/FNR family transcriptional regulator, cyclic AMP receptor protein